jgi:hypothetical protein
MKDELTRGNDKKKDAPYMSKKEILAKAITKATDGKLDPTSLTRIVQKLNIANRYSIKYLKSFRAYKEMIDASDVFIVDVDNNIIERTADYVETLLGPIANDTIIKVIHDDGNNSTVASDVSNCVKSYVGKAASYNVCDVMAAVKRTVKSEFDENKPVRIRESYTIYIFIKNN